MHTGILNPTKKQITSTILSQISSRPACKIVTKYLRNRRTSSSTEIYIYIYINIYVYMYI